MSNAKVGPMSDSISAFRIYFIADSDAAEKFVSDQPSPWHTHGLEPCKIARPNANAFKDAWSVMFWTESLGGFDSKADLEKDLLRALKDTRITYYVAEDVSELTAERERLEKIRIGLRKSAASTPSPPG